jgi:Protein of unknown function (DUF3307)
MFDTLYLILIALFVKHWYIDFVNQTQEEVENKGTYGHWYGVMHSAKHGALTAVIFASAFGNISVGLLLGFIDMVLHYHIDYVKMRFGTRDMYTKAFWTQFGADQLAHALTYILLLWLVV